jgi:hypothetical protein
MAPAAIERNRAKPIDFVFMPECKAQRASGQCSLLSNKCFMTVLSRYEARGEPHRREFQLAFNAHLEWARATNEFLKLAQTPTAVAVEAETATFENGH